jgi:hypothetical protein
MYSVRPPATRKVTVVDPNASGNAVVGPFRASRPAETGGQTRRSPLEVLVNQERGPVVCDLAAGQRDCAVVSFEAEVDGLDRAEGDAAPVENLPLVDAASFAWLVNPATVARCRALSLGPAYYGRRHHRSLGRGATCSGLPV